MRVNTEILKALENESIEILRETAASFRKPVLMYSIGKDSSVLLHLAKKAFYPAPIPFQLLHIDTTWKFKEMISFRDKVVAENSLSLIVNTNKEGVESGVNPFTTGISEYTRIMKTVALRQALDLHQIDAAIGGSRRDEEKSRAKERIFSVREEGHAWNPRNQRPEMWRTYNTRLAPGQTMRVFPISDWTELDVWRYIEQEKIEVNPLYFAKKRPVVKRGDQLIMVDDALRPQATTQFRKTYVETYKNQTFPWNNMSCAGPVRVMKFEPTSSRADIQNANFMIQYGRK